MMLDSNIEKLEIARRLDLEDQREEARQAYQVFLALEPGHPDAWSAYGGLLIALGSVEEAESACLKALEIEPDHRIATLNLANARVLLGRPEEAEKLNRRILEKNPRDEDALLSLSGCLHRMGDLEAASLVLEQLLRIQPAHRLARSALNTLYIHLGSWDRLRRNKEQQLLQFSGAEADFERSHLLLQFGEMPEGWLLNEARLRIPGKVLPKRSFREPSWRGEPFREKVLLIHYEQGLGDTIMYLRYLPMVKALGGKILLMVQPDLVALAATCSGADEVLSDGGDLPSFDLHISLLSLPAVLGTKLSTIPAEIPYLDVPGEVPNRAHIARVLKTANEGVRIGLVWAGNPHHKRDRERSVPPKALGILEELPGIYWFSFQLGQIESPPLRRQLPLAPLLSNFSDTAYALSGMDMVITVDTAMAHLAGSMGIPTFLLLDFEPDSRWMLGREDSPWYPSMRIYRQPTHGDWESVLQRVLTDLAASNG